MNIFVIIFQSTPTYFYWFALISTLVLKAHSDLWWEIDKRSFDSKITWIRLSSFDGPNFNPFLLFLILALLIRKKRNIQEHAFKMTQKLQKQSIKMSKSKYEYIYEDILDERVRNGKVWAVERLSHSVSKVMHFQKEYLVKWENTWEPKSNFRCSSKMIAVFNRKTKLSSRTEASKEEVNDDKDLHSNNNDRHAVTGEIVREPERILDVLRSSVTGQITAVVQWKGESEATNVPLKIVRNLYKDLLLDFYESHMQWKSPSF